VATKDDLSRRDFVTVSVAAGLAMAAGSPSDIGAGGALRGRLAAFDIRGRRVREWPPSGGTSAAAESVLDAPELERAGEALLDALNWHGVAMVEGKRTPEGQFVLMEINAKFWGSHDLALAAGVNFPGDMVALLEGRTIAQPQPPYRAVRCSWPLGGDLWHAIAKPSAWPRVLADALSPRVAHTFRLKDPVPVLYELAQWARSTPNALKEARELS